MFFKNPPQKEEGMAMRERGRRFPGTCRQKAELFLPVVMDHANVVEPHEGPTGPYGQAVVVLGVDGQTLGLHQLATVLRQVNQHLRVFAVLPKVILAVREDRVRGLGAQGGTQMRSQSLIMHGGEEGHWEGLWTCL